MDSDEESYEYDDGSDPGDSIHMKFDNDESRCTKELETRELSREDEIALRKKLKEKDVELRASMSTEEKGTGAEKRRKINPKDELVSSANTVDVLSNELINFMKMGRRDGYNILAVDNNPYKWVFRMHRFETDTEFYSDLTVVDSMYDYSFVEFQFEFAMDLYPMYPPTISICRPRFEGFMQGKIANLWTLKIDHWHPISGLGETIQQLRSLVEHEGKIDTSSPLNSLQYSSSYSKLEHLLLEHSITTEIPPNDMSSRSALSRSKQASDKKSTAGGAALRYGSGVAAAYASGAYDGGGSGGKAQGGEAVEGAAGLSASKSTDVVAATEGGDMNVENAENQTAKDAEKEGGVSEVSSSVEVEKGTAKATGDAQNFAWASGVGYGSNRAPKAKASLDPAKLAAAKAERDFRRGTLLWRISVEISRCLCPSPSPPSSSSSSSSSCISSSETGPGAVGGASSMSGGAGKEVEAVDKCEDDEYKTDKEDKEDKDGDEGQPRVIATLSESQILQALRESSLLPCIQEFLEYPIAEVDRSPSLVYVVCLVLELLSDHRWPVLWGLLEAPILPLSEANESSSSSSSSSSGSSASKSGVATLGKLTLSCLSKAERTLERYSFGQTAEEKQKVQQQQEQERIRQQGQQQGARLSDILIPSAAEMACDSLARYDTQCKQLEQRQGQDDTALLQMYARSLRLAAQTYQSLSEAEAEAEAGAGADNVAEAPVAATGLSSGSSATSSSSSSSSGGSTGTGVDDDGTIVEKEARYRDVMLPLQYSDITYDGAVGAGNYLYHAEAAKDNSNTFVKARTKALVLTHQTLEEGGTLPLSLSSSIWVRTLNSRMDCVKVMISGPQNTPYENGLFLFDAFFPVDFPAKPPKVLITTTGRGTVRFNPNLYAEGKVCLSLLGTWHGQSDESWNRHSTFYQVLLSIQSLIFVDEPYYNEPGYESRADATTSRAYNHNLWPSTVRWAMIDMIRNPPRGFEPVVAAHFRLRKREVLAQVRAWAQGQDSPSVTSKAGYDPRAPTSSSSSSSSSSSDEASFNRVVTRLGGLEEELTGLLDTL